MLTAHSIAVIPGDGIGQEVIPGALAVLSAAGEATDQFRLVTHELPWSCEHYLAHGEMMPADGIDTLRGHDAIFLGAVGFPGVADAVSLRGLLLPIRQQLDQYVNLRPIRVLPGIASPVRGATPETVDILCIRENTEGEYAGVGGRLRQGTEEEAAIQTSVFTRRGVERVIRYAFEAARARGGTVASATKSNAMQYTAVLWDEVAASVAAEYSDIVLTPYHVDALAARFVTAPASLDVVVASNLFGDILTDLGGALQGSLGIPASANLDPTRRHPSMFEPVHGSAPGRAGTGTANPIAAVWAGALMLDHLGESTGAAIVMSAIELVAREGPRTRDIGGTARTQDVIKAMINAIRHQNP